MDKLKYIKFENSQGQYTESIPLGVDSKNVDLKTGYNLEEILGNYNLTKGTIEERLNQNNNIQIDKTLTQENTAADSKAVGDAINIPILKIIAPYQGERIQGDCTILSCDGFSIIIDFGSSAGTTAILKSIRANNITKIDAAIISHYHSDHVGGLSEILNSEIDFSSCTFYLPPTPDYSKCVNRDGYITSTYKQLENSTRNIINNNNYNIVVPENNTYTKFNNFLKCRWLNISPNDWNYYYPIVTDAYGKELQHTSMNLFSMVCEFYHGKNIILLTGDIEEQSEKRLNNYITKTPTIYKIQHHGVNQLCNNDFMNKMHPTIAFVEGIGNASHFYPDSTMGHIINQCNILLKFETLIESDGFSCKLMDGSSAFDNLKIDNYYSDITDINSVKTNGFYRINGNIVGLEQLGITSAYGFLIVVGKGSFINQLLVILGQDGVLARTYRTSTDEWSSFKGFQFTNNYKDLDDINITIPGIYRINGLLINGKNIYGTLIVTGRASFRNYFLFNHTGYATRRWTSATNTYSDWIGTLFSTTENIILDSTYCSENESTCSYYQEGNVTCVNYTIVPTENLGTYKATIIAEGLPPAKFRLNNPLNIDDNAGSGLIYVGTNGKLYMQARGPSLTGKKCFGGFMYIS